MAEIKVDERRNGPSPPRAGFRWWWLLPLLLIIPVFLLVRGSGDSDHVVPGLDSASTAPVASDSVVPAAAPVQTPVSTGEAPAPPAPQAAHPDTPAPRAASGAAGSSRSRTAGEADEQRAGNDTAATDTSTSGRGSRSGARRGRTQRDTAAASDSTPG
ncbi:MAG TPA: hypothetical protein VFJ82_00955 [Longimicrobium sp.]|nr:hypothetical protein [Longimicrobium sp.]